MNQNQSIDLACGVLQVHIQYELSAYNWGSLGGAYGLHGFIEIYVSDPFFVRMRKSKHPFLLCMCMKKYHGIDFALPKEEDIEDYALALFGKQK